MRTMFRCLMVSILASSAAFAQSTASETKPVISLTISSRPTAKVGSTVGIHIVVKNISAHEVAIVGGVKGRDYKIDVRDVNGKLAPDTKLGLIYNGHVSITNSNQIDPKDLNGKAVYGTLKAGETSEGDLDAAKFYDMSKPGEYLIFIQKWDPEAEPLLTVKSNTISVTMIP